MDLQQIPKNDSLWTAFNMYQTSDQTMALKTEKNRTIFCEQFKNPQAMPLSTICLKVIAENYKGRPISLMIKPLQLKVFYDFIDIELPIENCINITDEYYWKRAYAQKCTDKVLIKLKSNDRNVVYKNLVITIKLRELIENTPYEIWIPDLMDSITQMASPYVTELEITKLQPKRKSTFLAEAAAAAAAALSVASTVSEEEDLEEQQEPEEDEEVEEVEPEYLIKDCHHVDLSVLMNLNQLHSLTVEFLPPELGINYHSRYFNFSYVDMQNLAKGISELKNLRVFKIRRSRMDFSKLSTILEALKYIFVEHIEFYFCQLDDECGESLYEFLIANASLKHFNLTGNYFSDSAIDYIAQGLEISPSELSFLGLSNNPIAEERLCQLIDILLQCEKLAHVTLSGIQVSEKGCACITKLVKEHPSLEELEIIAVPMDGSALVDALNPNTKIQQLLCQGCGITLDEEFKIELLLRRNRYVKQNPYIGDPSKTQEEINAFVSRIKNPVLVNALADIERRKECQRKQAEREQNPSEKSLDIKIPDETTSEKEKDHPRHKNVGFKDLEQRVTLFGQSDKSFFKKNKPGK